MQDSEHKCITRTVSENASTTGEVANQVEVSCMADKLPEFIAVDCSVLNVTKRAIHVSDLNLPEGVSIPDHGQQDQSVVTVKIKNAAAKLAGNA